MTDNTQKGFSTQEQRSNGGKSRARNLSPQRRKEISILANAGRKCYQGLPRATHMGTLKIGEMEIACAVLENGERVITQTTFNASLGRSIRSGSTITSKGPRMLPNFLAPEGLQKYISNELRELASPKIFLQKSGGKAHGFSANLLPQVCDVYLKARENGDLTPQQTHIAHRCEILVRALASIGIVSLVDEATGYQKQRETDELQRLFEKFIAKELQPWVKRFPAEFFNHLKRIYGVKEMKNCPSYFGHLINRYVYKELSPEIHEELRKINPVTEKGRREHAHHQFLTQDIGSPALGKQIQKVMTLMSVSDTKEELEAFLEKSKEINLGK